MSAATSRALVLGGGGIAGIAWESGLLAGLLDAGADLAAADLVVGTSAGSTVGAMLRAGAFTPDRLQALLSEEDPAVTQADEAGVEARAYDGAVFATAMRQAAADATDAQDVRRRIGRRALDEPVTTSEEAWVARIAARLPDAWPEGRLAVTAVDAEDGTFRVFDADDGVPLARAVAASCTLPTIFPLVHVEGRPYMDGGMRSASNADVAAGYDRILVVACSPEFPTSPMGPTLTEAVETLRSSSQVHVVVADDDSRAVFGTNTLDPASRGPAFRAGRAQAERIAQDVAAFWRG